MSLTIFGKNGGVEGATAKMKDINAAKTVVTAALTTARTSGKKFEMTGAKGKGFTNRKLVIFVKINGETANSTEPEKNKVAGLWLGRPYFVSGEETNAFELAQEPGGATVEPTAEVKTTTELVVLEEISGGSAKREKSEFGAPSAGEANQTKAVKLQIPASTEITYALWSEKAKSSEESSLNESIAAVGKLEHAENYTGAGEYEFTTDKLEANALA